tara:strand:- start:239 stop:505 length:267 start_codon:yes stop_codon:yes gene_type:complete
MTFEEMLQRANTRKKKIHAQRLIDMRKSMEQDMELKKTTDEPQKEEMTTTASAGIPKDTKNMMPKDMWDKRRRKDKPPVLKRFKKYMG